jgi:hypothetical protein
VKSIAMGDFSTLTKLIMTQYDENLPIVQRVITPLLLISPFQGLAIKKPPVESPL